MAENGDYERRRGAGISWRMTSNREIVTGYTIDNLDTKNVEQAESLFEELFIVIREVLEKHEPCCMDNEKDRLTLCQAISKKLAVRKKDWKR